MGELTLADIRPADLFENPPSVWLTKEITRLQGAQGFHWGMFVSPQSLIATESIEKGTALTRYNYAKSYIYRIKALQNVSTGDILNAIADYGRSTYGMSENFQTAFNYLVNYWLPQYPWEGPPVPSSFPGWPGTPDVDKSFTKPLNAPVNCIQYITLIAKRLGYDILPPGQLVIQKNLEASPYLEYLGVLEIGQSDGIGGVLVKGGRSSLLELFMPQTPVEGPPLPVLLNLRWPWRGKSELRTWVGGK